MSRPWSAALGEPAGAPPIGGPLDRTALADGFRSPVPGTRDLVSCWFHDGAQVAIEGNPQHEYRVTFMDGASGRVFASAPMRPGQYTRAPRIYFVPWSVRVTDQHTGLEVFRRDLDLRGKRVSIRLLKTSLGDTLAWVPYLEAFAQVHGCRVVALTALSELFARHYPSIEWLPNHFGAVLPDIYASYVLGIWSRSRTAHPRYPVSLPLQQVATDILGLPFHELRPRVGVRWRGARKRVIGIATHTTFQMKYWNRPGGWDDIVRELGARGYRVKVFSNERDGHHGNFYPAGAARLRDFRWPTVLHQLAQCAAFIGLDSGLSWLAWAVGVPTAAIEGPSARVCMPSDVLKIESEIPSVCRECHVEFWGRPWRWDTCPRHQADARRYECTATIPPAQVLAAVETLLAQPRPTSAPADAAPALAVEAAP